MAETKVVNLEVKTNIDSVAKSFDKLGKSIDDTEKSVDNLNLTFDEVYGDLKPLTARMGEAEDRLYELGLAGKQATDEYKGLLNAVGNYKKVQLQTDIVVDAAAQTVGQKLGASLQGATSAFAGVQGAMGLIGVESEGLEKALLKVQSAMALSESVRGIREVMPAFSGLATMIKGPLIKAFTTLKGAIITTGIGALVVVLALAADSMGFFSDKTEDAAKAQEKLDADLKRTNESLERQKENLNKVLTIQDDATRQALIDAKKRGASQEELTQLEIEGSKERLKTLKDELGNKRGIMLWYSKNGSNDQYEAANKAYQDANQAYKQQNFLVQEKEQEILDTKKEKRKEDIADYKEKNEKKLLASIEARQNELEFEKYWNDELQKITDLEQAKKAVKIQQEKDDTEMLSAFKIQNWEFEAKRQQEIDDKALADKKIIHNQKIKAVQDTFTIIANLSELFAGKSRKQQETAFKIQKAANIANATIDTYKAVMSTYASTPGGPIIKGIAGGVVLTAGLLNVKKIASTQFSSGGASSGGGGSTSSGGGGGGGATNQAVTPNFNIVGNNGLNQLSQLKQGPIQAYVVSGQMSTAQSLDRNRVRNATL